MRKTDRIIKLFITTLLIVGVGFICFPIIKNTVTLVRIQRTTIQQTQVDPDQVPKNESNEKIELPTIGSYWSASTENLRESVGNLSIPSLKLTVPLFRGLHNQEMLFGVGMMFPKRRFNQDNVVILGHHLGMSELLLGNLGKVSLGDYVVIHYLDQVYTYQVAEKEIVKETNLSVIKDTDQPKLTLITCDSPYLTDQRIVVSANPVALKQVPKQVLQKEQTRLLQKKTMIRKNIVKYSVIPIIIIIGVLCICIYCIWRYL